MPNETDLRKQLSTALLAHSELKQIELGFYNPPDEIRTLLITNAAYEQIKIMWHGHRQRDSKSPPPMPLKFFVFGFGQSEGNTWVDIELLPRMDDWSVD